MNLSLSREFRNRIAGAFGSDGRQWLDDLPALLDEYAARWSLTILPPFEPLSYNFAAPATGPDGQAVVFKAGVPRPDLNSEIEALRVYAGRGCVQLLTADAQRGVMLLERIEPGTKLKAEPDDACATEIAAQVMQSLWQPLPAGHSFKPVTDWAAGLNRLRDRYGGGTGPLPADRVALAESLFAELFRTASPAVLLHGDLHHENILAGDRAPWLAIDPQGVAGEPAYEVGALLRNPMPEVALWPDLAHIQRRRVDQLAEILGFHRQRIVGYGVAQAVLSAAWTLEDHGEVDTAALACADALVPLLGRV
ncbi:MAG: phosphotransferase [Anaerolineae bacterium]|nr:phosphotransferase [Anaerolineae bacterium]